MNVLRILLLLSGYTLLVHFAAAVHLSQGLMIVFSPSAAKATPVFLIATWATPIGAAVLLITAALLAWAFVLYRAWWPLLLLQEGLLIMTAFQALIAISRGQYADGTMIPSPHIFADQIIYLYLAGAHALTMLRAGVSRVS